MVLAEARVGCLLCHGQWNITPAVLRQDFIHELQANDSAGGVDCVVHLSLGQIQGLQIILP